MRDPDVKEWRKVPGLTEESLQVVESKAHLWNRGRYEGRFLDSPYPRGRDVVLISTKLAAEPILAAHAAEKLSM
jgi:hypothetical protein